jgi:hypothetical protein
VSRSTWTLVVSTLMLCSGCSSAPTKPSDPSPLVLVACGPELQPPPDKSFAATTLALLEAVSRFSECRAAALAGIHLPGGSNQSGQTVDRKLQ